MLPYLLEVAVVGAYEGDGVLVCGHDSDGGDRGLVPAQDRRSLQGLRAGDGVVKVMFTAVVITNAECLQNEIRKNGLKT